MKIEIKVPAMGESITEATIGNILKPSGSKVNADDEILELETDKVNQVIYAPQSGIVTFTVNPGQTVKVGEVIGALEAVQGQGGEASQTKETAIKEAKPSVSSREASVPPPLLQPPLVKEEKAGGARLTKESFLKEFSREISEPPPFIPVKTPEVSKENEPQEQGRTTRKKMSRIRRVIAERLVEAQHTTAMLTTFNEVDMSAIMSLREKYKEPFAKQYNVRLGLMSFFVKDSVSALQAFPEFNSYIEGEDLVHREYYDIGIAVGTDKGLFVPVIRDCDKKSYAEIEAQLETFAAKAKEGTISVDDLQGGGFTITNGGVYGSLLSTPILNPSQCAILGMHKISKRAVVVEDQIVIKPMMYLALSYDHRIVDGKQAVLFLVHIKNLLEDPSRLLLNI
jgi:2-oxoglutarate dehydrogenase E2 component (dihydrolipoamide succinyltransferase)